MYTVPLLIILSILLLSAGWLLRGIIEHRRASKVTHTHQWVPIRCICVLDDLENEATWHSTNLHEKCWCGEVRVQEIQGRWEMEDFLP